METRYRFVLLLLIVGLLFSVGGSHQAVAQTDTEFWFVAPTVTKDHGWPGRKFSLRFASMSLKADIIVSMPDNPAFDPIPIALDPNSAESIDLTNMIEEIWNFPVDQVNNRGIRITSTSLITCYFEIGTFWNTDIFSLKGRNALGEDFYVPFQNHFANGDIYYKDHQPFSKIDIVATQDNTTVTITPSRPAYSGRPQGAPFQIILDRGQTYSVAPDEILSATYPAPGQLPENRLTGTRVQSDKPIAITTSDDSVYAGEDYGCMDVVGDQIVPVSIIGTEYIAMRSKIGQGDPSAIGMPELFYVTATQDHTVVYVDGLEETVIHEGETYPYVIKKQTHHIQTSSPSYVYHIGGFGCEMGGAILPPVNVCTGSTQVSFTRSKDEEFFLNILVRKGAEDGFVLNGDSTIISAADFKAVEGTDTWLAAEFDLTFDIPVELASLIENTKDVFHLGIINGGPGTGTMYGYFSDFNQHQITGMIVDSGTDFEAFCYGQPIQLVAHGGVNYSWSPADYLDDSFSQTPIALPDKSMQYVVTASGACGMTDSASVTIQVAEPLHAMFSVEEAVGCSPFEVNITDESFGVEFYSWDFGNEDTLSTDAEQFTYTYENNSDQVQTYVITLEGRNDIYCVDERSTTLTVYPEVKTQADADVVEGCAPLTVSFSGNSQHATRFDWDFRDGGSSSEEDTVYTFHNYTNNDIIYEVVFTADNESGCVVSDTLEITVKPFIQAGFAFDPAAHCNPHELKIFDTSVGAESYDWDFDDGKEIQHFDTDSFSYPFENLSSESRTFYIQQIVTNASGCADTLEKPFELYPYLEAAFEPSAMEGCSPMEVEFTNQSEGAVSYSWDFDGNLGSSSGDTPTIEFVNTTSEPRVHEVVLEATSAEGCTDKHIQEITVNPGLKADFSFENPEACQPHDFAFQDLSAGAGTLTWDFGDGSPPQQVPPGDINHAFPPSLDGPETYQVTLRAENAYGCNAIQVREVIVYPEVKAKASMVTSGCHPLEVAFENQSEGAASYRWTFDDGSTSSEENPHHAFINPDPLEDKVFNVQLMAESPTGCQSIEHFPITVFAKPKAAFELPADEGCAPFEAEMINHSEGHTTSLWDPGDGTPASNTLNLTHEYLNQEPGVVEYHPVLYVASENGCADTISHKVTVYPMVKAQVSLSDTEGCHPLAVDITNQTTGADATLPYRWTYGDGGTSVVETEVHSHEFNNQGHEITENFTLQLMASSAYGCEDSVQVDVSVHPRPEALFTGPAEPSCSPFEVAFEDQSLGTSLSYSWDFGDGAQSQDPGNTLHTYIQPPDEGLGWFTTSLRVENEFGCADTHTHEVGVYPLVTADFSEQQGCHPLVAQLDNLSQGATEFRWDFADGSLSSATTPEHTFLNSSGDQADVYQVTLMAVNEYDCSAEAVRDITVYPLPQADFNISDFQGCSPLNVTVFNLSEGVQTSHWIIGTEEFENGEDAFTHIFENLNETPEDITMTLEASNQWQCEKTFSQTVTVYPEVIARFSSTQQMEGCTPLDLPFINESVRAHQYEWSFGDGTRSTQEDPEHLFFSYEQTSRDYEVILKASSSFGCSDEFALPVRVHPRPVADFIPTPVLQTYPSATIEITNLSLPGQWQYKWDLGDGNILNQDEDPGSFSHTYRWEDDDFATRHYTIGLSVENPWCRDTTTREVVILSPEPVAALAAPERGCSPFEVQFENLSQYGLSYLWDFGDGSSSSERSPRHIYTKPGNYRVKLLVNGHTDMQSVFHDITVHQLPVADFRVKNAPPNASHISIQTVNLSSLASISHWQFGDGNESVEYSPTHLYRNAGTYDITLTVGTDTDPVCYDTLVKPAAIVVDDPCILRFPNAFVPATTGPGGGHYVTGDPLNQVFYPVFKGIEEYKLEIYNRWGELLFRSEELEKGWDGYHQGNLSKMDVYVWKVWARCYNGEEIRTAGDVTLYR